jgi:4-azaleucine resistance transporter AzlC
VTTTDQTPSARAEAFAGLRAIWPVALSAIPIGALFGAVAVARGLSLAEATLMSIIVFAGGAQFAAVELWATPLPVVALVLSTLLINLRHVLMGASLTPKMRGFSLGRHLLGFFFLTDEAWAVTEMRALAHRITPAFWFAAAGAMFVAWVASSVAGGYAGTFLGDPARIGADFAFAALFIGLIVGFWRTQVKGLAAAVVMWASVRNLVIVAASLIASALVYVAAGPPWHVAAGAAAGIVTAYFIAPPSQDPP